MEESVRLRNQMRKILMAAVSMLSARYGWVQPGQLIPVSGYSRQFCCFSYKLFVCSIKNQVFKKHNSSSRDGVHLGQPVEQLVLLGGVHQVAGGGSLPLHLLGEVQATRSWFYLSQDGHPLWWRLLHPLQGSCPGRSSGMQVIKAAGFCWLIIRGSSGKTCQTKTAHPI